MAERLRVRPVRRQVERDDLVCGFEYPVGADLARVLEVGGAQNLPEDERRAIYGYWDEQLKVRVPGRVKRVVPGDFCDDMPPSTIAIYLERGWIERVTVEDPTPRVTAKAESGGR
jgi:hypothetical protein